MAYIEIRKDGKLVKRYMVEDDQAQKGCRIRVGSAGQVHLRAGESKTLGKYEITILEGMPPDDKLEIDQLGMKYDSFPAMSQTDQAEFTGPSKARPIGKKSPVPVIDGYEVTGQLGQGGMGIVWRAAQLSTKREVALKFLSRHRFASKKSRARFEREVSLAAKLKHPNIACVYDSGLHRGVYYYAMEFVDGVHLDKYVQKNRLSQREILELIKDVCNAVGYAHKKGIIHRDLKPSNILVTTEGQPHIVDFGLAKTFVRGSEEIAISVEGHVAGTLAYMSPEQAAGWTDQINERSDVYSLGVILYYLLTSQLPRDVSGSYYEVLRRIVENEVQSPREADVMIDSRLEALLIKALDRDPDRRYADAGALADDINNYLVGERLDAKSITGIALMWNRLKEWRRRFITHTTGRHQCVANVSKLNYPEPAQQPHRSNAKLSIGSPIPDAEVTIWEGRASLAYLMLWCIWDSLWIVFWAFLLSNTTLFLDFLRGTVPELIPESKSYLESPYLKASYFAYFFLIMLFLVAWRIARRLLAYLSVYYVFTTQRFKVREGILSHDFLQAEFYRIKDLFVVQTFWGRLFNYAHVQLVSTDRLIAEKKGEKPWLKGIPDGVRIAEEIRLKAQRARSQAGLMAIRE